MKVGRVLKKMKHQKYKTIIIPALRLIHHPNFMSAFNSVTHNSLIETQEEPSPAHVSVIYALVIEGAVTGGGSQLSKVGRHPKRTTSQLRVAGEIARPPYGQGIIGRNLGAKMENICELRSCLCLSYIYFLFLG